MGGDSRHEVLRKVFNSGLAKSDRSRLAIIEGAIACFAESGYEKTTFSEIAKRAAVSRPLVLHYFKQKEVLLRYCFEYVIQTAQESVAAGIRSEPDARTRLGRWIDVNFAWALAHPSHVKLWGLFLYRCTYERHWREVNKRIKRTAQDRVTAILREGLKDRSLRSRDPERDGVLIQLALHSAILSLGTDQLRLSTTKIRSGLLAAL